MSTGKSGKVLRLASRFMKILGHIRTRCFRWLSTGKTADELKPLEPLVIPKEIQEYYDYILLGIEPHAKEEERPREGTQRAKEVRERVCSVDNKEKA